MLSPPFPKTLDDVAPLMKAPAFFIAASERDRLAIYLRLCKIQCAIRRPCPGIFISAHIADTQKILVCRRQAIGRVVYLDHLAGRQLQSLRISIIRRLHVKIDILLLVRLETPTPIQCNIAESLEIVHVIEDQRLLIRIARINSQCAHRLLNKKRQRSRRAREDHAIHVRHVKALAEQIDVAQNFNLPAPKLLDDLIAIASRSVAVEMLRTDARLVE